MKLMINGKEKEFENTAEMTVSTLLVENEVASPDMVSVELNGEILQRADFEHISLAEGDKVEFLYFMGGGRWI